MTPAVSQRAEAYHFEGFIDEGGTAMGAAATSIAKGTELRSNRLNTLQAGRAAACLAVLLFHANAILSLPKYLGHDVFPLFKSGACGVQFFFVLSGFVIFLVHEKDLGKSVKIGDFAWKRFRRVYPPLWMVLLVLIPAYFAVPSLGTGGEKSGGLILSTFFLAPDSRDTLLAPAWTLRHEILFYLIFCVSVWKRSVGLVVGVAWVALSALVPFFQLAFPWNFFFNSNHVLFVFGVVTCLAFKRLSVVPAAATAIAAFGAAMFAATWFAELYHVVSQPDALTLIYGCAASLLVFGLVVAERDKGVKVPRVLVFLGEASYSIYLVHYSVLSLSIKVVSRIRGELHIQDGAVFAICASLGLICGGLFHQMVERPLIERLPTRLRLRKGGWRKPRTKPQSAGSCLGPPLVGGRNSGFLRAWREKALATERRCKVEG